MTPSCVEDATIALRANPSPRLQALAFFPVLKNSPILLVVECMNVGFIPALEATVTLHQRMGCSCVTWLNAEDSRAVTLKLRTDQSHNFRLITKAKRSTV